MRISLLFVGVLLILIGIFIISSKSKFETTNTKFAFGGFIGPFPFGFANSPAMLWVIIGIALTWIIINLFLK